MTVVLDYLISIIDEPTQENLEKLKNEINNTPKQTNDSILLHLILSISALKR